VSEDPQVRSEDGPRQPAGERDDLPPGRARCPTCGARRGGRDVCHRCKSDLSLLRAVEARADQKLAEAVGAYREGRFRQAAALATEAHRVEARPECLKLLAASAARAGDFITAVRVARGFTNA
jgi:hypothetical protein